MGHSGYCIRLHHVAYSERCHGREHGKQNCQPFGSQTALERIHGTSEITAIGLTHAILDSQQTLGILSGDAKHTREPAPEHRTRASDGHCSGDAHNVPRAYSSRQSGGQRAKLRHFAVCTSIAAHR